MASDTTLLQNLSIVTDSLSSALDGVPNPETLAPPSEGLSLLDTKNELLLSYLQNLVFLILYKLRNPRDSLQAANGDATPSHIDIVKNLVSLRLYLEKGVRPLESRLKYQLDKLLLAASEADKQGALQIQSSKTQKTQKTASASGESEGGDELNAPAISDLSHRPNISAFTRPRRSSPSASSKRDANIYRPPRITPTALPSTDRPSKDQNRKRKNNMLETFVREELSTAPVAEPSVGAGTGLRGRDAEKERERNEYEELRLVRLPTEGKKKGKGRKERMGGGFDEVLGGAGEGLGEAVHGGGKRRKIAGGGGGEGRQIGEAWEKRKMVGVRGLGGKRR
ncbi:MAG: hypothetical protein Q9169_002423 [Polycauliona sp. 2 TL-2023]